MGGEHGGRLPLCAVRGAVELRGIPGDGVPAGLHASKAVPLSVQLVVLPGSEPVLLSLASQLEELRPWARHAPMAGT